MQRLTMHLATHPLKRLVNGRYGLFWGDLAGRAIAGRLRVAKPQVRGEGARFVAHLPGGLSSDAAMPSPAVQSFTFGKTGEG